MIRGRARDQLDGRLPLAATSTHPHRQVSLEVYFVAFSSTRGKGIAWKGRRRMWARMYSSYLLGSDVGSLWSQGWEETPISIGCEIRNFWKRWRKYAVGSPGPSDIETGIDWNRMRPEAKALLRKVGTHWLLFFVSLSYSYRRICWAPMSNHYCRKG